MTEPDFLSKWRLDLASGNIGVQLVEVDHPLEVYVGASDMSLARVQIRSTVKPKLPTLSDLVLVDRKLQGGMWVLTFTLQDPHFDEVFIRLAGHLVERSRSQLDEKSAWLAVDAVLDEWQRLLRPRPAGVLSMDELRGLFGELWLVRNRFAQELGIEAAIAGWLGPLGSPQDFWFEDSGLHEAKSIGPTATKIKFSSAEQLDADAMELIVLQLGQVPETTAGAMNLPSLVQSLKAALDSASIPHKELDLRLARLGVKIDDPYYADIWFTVAAFESYEVTSEFPAIRARALPLGISGVRYQLDRSAIASFMTTTSTT